MRKLRSILVLLGLMFLFLAAVVYIIQFGARYPYSDDWNLVPYLVRTALDWEWLWAPHGEHRIALPKLIQWLSFRVSGDYRTPSLIVAALFAALAVFITVVSARIRGRVSVVDLVPALACFHFAQGFLQWGFHTQFGSSTFLIGLLVIWLASRTQSEEQAWETWDLAALLVILLALTASGTNGSVPALILSGYFILRVICQPRHCNNLSALSSFLIIAGLAVSFVLSLTILLGIPKGGAFRAQHFRDVIEVALRVAISPAGVVVMDTRGPIGAVVRCLLLALFAFAFVLAIEPVLYYAKSFHSTEAKPLQMVASQWPAPRVDFLVVGFSIIAVVLAVGIGRGGRGWDPGLEMHYGVVALPLVFWSYLSLVVSWRDRFARICVLILVLLFASTYFGSIPLANRIGKLQEERRVAFEGDLKAGKAVDDIIGDHVAFLYWVDTPDVRRSVRNGLLLLKAEAGRDNYRRPALQPYLWITDRSH